MSIRALQLALLPTTLALVVARTACGAQQPAPATTLTAFGSERELADYLESVRALRARLIAEEQSRLAKATRCQAAIVADRHRQVGRRDTRPARAARKGDHA